MTLLPTDAQERKAAPMAEGLLYYFPAALAEVARVSKRGNDQHNPGQPLHHARGKSTDHADCIIRHLVDAGSFDTDGMRHTAKVAWRALALLQEEMERGGAPIARNARMPDDLDRPGAERGRNAPLYDPDDVRFSRPICSSSEVSAHPMHAEALRMAEERLPSGFAERFGEAFGIGKPKLVTDRDDPPFARCAPYGGTD